MPIFIFNDNYIILYLGGPMLLATINNLINNLLNETNTTKQLQIIDEINKIRDHYLTLYWCSSLGYLKDIKDKKCLTSEKLFYNN